MKLKMIAFVILGWAAFTMIAILTKADKRLGVNAFILGPLAHCSVVALSTCIALFARKAYRRYKSSGELTR